ncbi:MAG: hypothetical protein K6E30_02770 [Lachnospiraceae bacterium]|nr:hypothetical protein [Lachnospiraceae bacterium]
MRAGRRIIEKLRSSRGVTLMEQMVAVALLVMVSSLLAAGIPVAISAYNKVVKTANAQVLLSTTITELRDELGMACEVYKCGENGSENPAQHIIFRKEGTGKIRISYDAASTGNQGIQYAYLDNDEKAMKILDGDVSVNPRLLVSDAAAANLHAAFDSISYDADAGTISVRGLMVYDKDAKAVLKEKVDLTIRMKVAKG